jgi:hypothetical protein
VADRPRRFLELERLEKLLVETVLDLFAGDVLEDHAEQHIIRVAVMPALPRREVGWMLDAHVDKLARRLHTLEVGERGLHPRVVLCVVVKSARHVGEHEQRNLVAVGHPRDVLAHRVVEAEPFLVREDQKEPRGGAGRNCRRGLLASRCANLRR